MILQFIANGIITGSIYALTALGFGLIYNTTRIFHIAYGAVYTTSAYVFYTFYKILNLPLFVSVIAGIAGGVILGILIEMIVYYPLYKRKASSGIFIISSIGVYIFIVNLIAMVFGNEVKILSPGIEKTYEFWGIILTRIQLIEFGGFLIMFLFYIFLLKRTSFGKMVRAVASNPFILPSFGVNVRKLRIEIFAAGSFFASLSSCMVAWDIGMDPHVGMPVLLVSAVSVIVGGVGVFLSPALGGLLIGLTQSLVVWRISARWEQAVTFVILILFLLFRPQGLLGIRKRVEEVL